MFGSGELEAMVFVIGKKFFARTSMRLHLGAIHTIRNNCGAD